MLRLRVAQRSVLDHAHGLVHRLRVRVDRNRHLPGVRQGDDLRDRLVVGVHVDGAVRVLDLVQIGARDGVARRRLREHLFARGRLVLQLPVAVLLIIVLRVLLVARVAVLLRRGVVLPVVRLGAGVQQLEVFHFREPWEEQPGLHKHDHGERRHDRRVVVLVRLVRVPHRQKLQQRLLPPLVDLQHHLAVRPGRADGGELQLPRREQQVFGLHNHRPIFVAVLVLLKHPFHFAPLLLFLQLPNQLATLARIHALVGVFFFLLLVAPILHQLLQVVTRSPPPLYRGLVLSLLLLLARLLLGLRVHRRRQVRFLHTATRTRILFVPHAAGATTTRALRGLDLFLVLHRGLVLALRQNIHCFSTPLLRRPVPALGEHAQLFRTHPLLCRKLLLCIEISRSCVLVEVLRAHTRLPTFQR
mmetsp:Transcript_14024/g.34732  ORF Transcript_14024/g.34732 Transcript_14024/m.34732 type:complete len:415 (-) Transcript_14024:3972-5216(-)